MDRSHEIAFALILGLTVAGFVTTAAAEGPSTEAATAKAAADEEALPISFSADYTLVSDYVWRGQNFSEYVGEGREKANHQATVGLSYEAGKLGTFSGSVWCEWFAGQKSLDPASSRDLQEVDYTLSWSYEVPAVSTTVELGWIWYHFPEATGDASFTHEWYASLSLDDSVIFGTKGPVLNPSVAYYMDLDDVRGGWIECGISHDFGLADCGFKDARILRHTTLTPSFVVGIDEGQISGSTEVGNLQLGQDISYDLSSALGMPEGHGSLTLTGFLRFSDAIYDKAINDEFWGGITIAYER